MAESIKQRLAKLSDKNEVRELRALLNATQADLAALRAQFAQLITDYNANANIVDNTTAVAPTLTLEA